MFRILNIALLLILFVTLPDKLTADSKKVPLLIVPGFFGTLPEFNYYLRFLFERGVSPETFEVVEEYGMLVDKFESEGYILGKDLYFAGFDWRLPPAKIDSLYDGIIHSSAGDITDNIYTTGLDYLGYFLLQAAINNPGIKEVDVFSHSTGGIVTKAYLQSLAYNRKVYKDGKVYTLPRIRKFIMAGVPSEGTPFAWNPWHGNMLSMQGFGRAGDVLFLVYEAIRKGLSDVNGDDYIIRSSSLIDPITQSPDMTRFIRLYMPSIKTLMPSYPFLYDLEGQVVEPQGTEYDNLLLNDLNTIKSSMWTDKVKEVIVTFGMSENTYQYTLTKKGRGGKKVLLNNVSGSVFTAENEIWYLDSLLENSGDGVVPLRSLISNYSDDPKIRIMGWSRIKQPTDAIPYKETNGNTNHVYMFGNPEIVNWIADLITK